jgi:amidase
MEELTIHELQAKMEAGELTSVALVGRCLERIDQLDRAGPRLNAVLEVNPDAVAIAAALDRERAASGPRGPLHGIPILLKDNLDTADRMTTTAGSLALEGSIPAQDSFVAGRLREAGAVLLGKANLSEWANFRSTRSTSGWSSRGGQTRNPYALDRNPCGSSSGSAVAVAADLCPAAIGTETDGSIICPAQANGLVGIKPTVGLVSRAGIIPISHSQDTAGPLARTVADAAAVLGALTGIDPRDPATEGSRGRGYSDYSSFLDPAGLQRARIGVARQFFGAHHQVDAAIASGLEVMSRLGAELVDPVKLPKVKDFWQSELEGLLYEFKAGLNRYLATLGPAAPAHNLREIIAFNEANRERVMPYFGQELMEAAEEKGPLTEEGYREALATCHRLAWEEGIHAALAENRLDAIVAPSGIPAWPTDLVLGDHHYGGSSSHAAVAGTPNITVPAGYAFGLPFGISFFGGAYGEPTLIRIAYAFEQATRVRRRPTFRASAETRD